MALGGFGVLLGLSLGSWALRKCFKRRTWHGLLGRGKPTAKGIWVLGKPEILQAANRGMNSEGRGRQGGIKLCAPVRVIVSSLGTERGKGPMQQRFRQLIILSCRLLILNCQLASLCSETFSFTAAASRRRGILQTSLTQQP